MSDEDDSYDESLLVVKFELWDLVGTGFRWFEGVCHVTETAADTLARIAYEHARWRRRQGDVERRFSNIVGRM